MYNIKKDRTFKALPFFFLLIIVCIIFAIPKENNSADAGENSTVAFITATCQSLDSATLTYSDTQFDIINSGVYKKNVKVYFTITNNSDVSYYKFGIEEQNMAEYTLDPIDTNGQASEIVSYQFTDNTGIFNITCYIYNDEDMILDSATVTVKSDCDVPNSFGTVNSMTSYQKGGTFFNVSFDLSNFSDALSGQKEVYYSFRYKGAMTDLISYRKAETTSNTFEIEDNGTLKIVYIDNAGNYATKEYHFDKFDKIAPAIPVISVAADSDTVKAGGYTRSYTVTITYGSDIGSGTANAQFYVINGETRSYTVPFKLNTAEKQFIIRANTVDNVGNASSFAEAIVSGDNLDIYEPTFNGLKFSVDLMKEKPLAISFISTDAHSGIDYAFIEDLNVYFTSGVSNTYSADFASYGKTGLVIHVVDKVGNDKITHIVINYFGDSKKAQVIKAYYDIYHTLDFSLYTQGVIDEIKQAYLHLNIALMAENTQNSEFDTLYRRIDKLISGESNHTYSIETVPNYISSSISYHISEDDLDSYKKGDSVLLVLNALTLDNEKQYVKMTDFSKGFAEAFNLSAYYKEQMLTNLANGIFVEMNMPYGYYERKIVIINKTTNEILETSTYNNKIAFTLKDSGDYVMVISGEKLKNANEKPKTVKVFGKAMPYPAFFGIIFGTLGGCALIVGILIVIKKKRG